MRKSILIAAAAMAVATAAFAADAPPDPADVARARAEADAMIARAKAGDVFENATEDAGVRVRHKGSGMTCGFDGSPDDSVTVFNSGLPRGDDVGCESKILDLKVSFYATKFPQPMTVDQATAYYVDSIRRVHPEAKPFTGSAADLSIGGDDGAAFPPIRTARFVIVIDGKRYYSRLSVAVVKGWVIEERVTGPEDKATEADLMGGLFMLSAVNDVHGGDLMKKAP